MDDEAGATQPPLNHLYQQAPHNEGMIATAIFRAASAVIHDATLGR